METNTYFCAFIKLIIPPTLSFHDSLPTSAYKFIKKNYSEIFH